MRRRDRGGPAGFHEADGVLMDNLDDLENAPRYAAWILELVSPHVGGRILEVGAGRGTYSESLARLGTLTAVEPSATGFGQLAARLAPLEGVTVVHGDLHAGLADPPFDSVVLLNVLEHIDDDAGAVAAIAEGLAPGGRVVLWVPAFPLLLGEFDRSIGHHRRYRKRPLEQLVRAAGLEVVESRYRNLPGWFAWLLVVRVMRARPTTSRLAAAYDRVVVPVIRLVERRVPMPFGQSVLLVARRPG